MNEERVFFEGDHRLEGMLGFPALEEAVTPSAVRGGVVVAHPYPPHGATMDIPVIYRIAQSCRERGFATLRFNFRSVGQSGGSFSGTDEHRDVGAAVSFMSGQLGVVGTATGALPPVGVVGWSFGSAMAARAAAELREVRALVLVGFPIDWEHLPADTLGRLAGYRGPVLAVCAENDQHGVPERVAGVLQELGLEPEMELVSGADHYLAGREREVGRLVAGFLDRTLGGV